MPRSVGGSLPGAFTDLVIECARLPAFEHLTPISQRLISAREREELVVRFFTFLESYNVCERDLPNWKDRPREYIFEFVDSANSRAREAPDYIPRLREEFGRMLTFVSAAFPHGFLKAPNRKQVPRARYEAIAVGSGLAIRSCPALINPPIGVVNWTNDDDFRGVTTSDAANVRSKVIGRIEYVRQRLLA